MLFTRVCRPTSVLGSWRVWRPGKRPTDEMRSVSRANGQFPRFSSISSVRKCKVVGKLSTFESVVSQKWNWFCINVLETKLANLRKNRVPFLYTLRRATPHFVLVRSMAPCMLRITAE